MDTDTAPNGDGSRNDVGQRGSAGSAEAGSQTPGSRNGSGTDPSPTLTAGSASTTRRDGQAETSSTPAGRSPTTAACGTKGSEETPAPGENRSSNAMASQTQTNGSDHDEAGTLESISSSLGSSGEGQPRTALDPAPQEMPLGPGTSKLESNDVIAAATGGLGVNSTTDAANRFTKTKQLGEEILPVPLPDQTYGFMSVAGPHQATKAPSCYVRIGGMFPDEDERELHIDDLPQGNYFVANATVAETFGAKVFASKEEKDAYIARIRKAWNVKFVQKEKRFDAHIEERHTFENDEEEKQVDAKEKETFARNKSRSDKTAAALRQAYEADKAKLRNKETRKDFKKKLAKQLKSAHTVIDQSWAVVSFLYDPEEEDLPIKTQWVVILWACFPDDTRARNYISDTLQHEIPGLRFYPIKMYKYISPDVTLTKEFKKKVRGIYKYQEQQDMWDGAHQAKPNARRFREKFRDLEEKASMQKLIDENGGKSTAEILAMAIEEDDANDVVTKKAQ